MLWLFNPLTDAGNDIVKGILFWYIFFLGGGAESKITRKFSSKRVLVTKIHLEE